MQEILVKYKKTIIRTAGALLLLVGFVIHFWENPKEGLSDLDIAAANVARMEASVAHKSANTQTPNPNLAPLFEEFKNTREKQMKYFTILAMAFGVIFLLYSFFQKSED